MKAKLLFLLFSLVFLANVTQLSAQDRIYKTDSTVIESKVLEVGDVDIRYKKFSNPDGPTYSVKKVTVSYIVYQNGDKEVYTTAKAASSPPAGYDTLAYLEKMLGVKLMAVTAPDTGCQIIAVERSSLIKSPGMRPPLNNIIQYVGTSGSKNELRKSGARIRTTEDFTRAIVLLKQQGATYACFLIRYNAHVDHVYVADLTTLDLSGGSAATASATSTNIAKTKTKPPCAYKKSHFVVEGGIAFRNQYLIGDLNTWFMELNQTPDGGVTDGTSSYYYASFGVVFPLNKERARPVCLGAVAFINPPHGNPLAWPIQGRVVTFASSSPVNYIRLKPRMMGVTIPLRIPISDYSAVIVSPSVVYASLTGYSYGSTDPDTRSYGAGSDGIGLSGAMGIEFFFGKKKNFGMTMHTGYRSLKTDLNYSANGSAYAPVQFQDGSPVRVNLGGGFLLLGMTIRSNAQK